MNQACPVRTSQPGYVRGHEVIVTVTQANGARPASVAHHHQQDPGQATIAVIPHPLPAAAQGLRPLTERKKVKSSVIDTPSREVSVSPDRVHPRQEHLTGRAR
jgi:hypothetical protein